MEVSFQKIRPPMTAYGSFQKAPLRFFNRKAKFNEHFWMTLKNIRSPSASMAYCTEKIVRLFKHFKRVHGNLDRSTPYIALDPCIVGRSAYMKEREEEAKSYKSQVTAWNLTKFSDKEGKKSVFELPLPLILLLAALTMAIAFYL